MQDYEKVKDKVIAAQNKIKAREAKAEDCSATYEQKHQALEDAKRTHKQIKEGLAPLKEEQASAKRTFTGVADEMKEIQRSQRTIKTNIDNYNREIKGMEQKIAEENRRIEAQNGGSVAALNQVLADAEQQLREAKAEEDDHPSRKPALEHALDVATKKSHDVQDAVRRKQDDVAQAEDKLRTLSQGHKDPMRAYAPSLGRLLQAIARETRFADKPVGPMGMYVKLNKPMWSPILENYFGAALNSFVVTSKKDEKLLSELLRLHN